ncbi:phage tail protein [Streptomyces albus]|uniref:phage tail tube protein n=1 Tax=Streptomyces albus TaxID=1888 RepID=UPI0024E15175|nr:phage tail protein [Streptomyces albus]GHJ21618.1 tail protein [Streptomyces albus]
MVVQIERAADLAVIGANGGIWVAAVGTSAPSSPLEQPAAPWEPLGAISDDGLVYGFDEDSEEFTPWGTTSPFRSTITKSTRTFQFTLWETARTTAMSVMYRTPVSELTPDQNGITAYAETASPAVDRRAWWFAIFDGDTARGMYVPQAEVSDRSDVTFKQDEMSGYEVTLTAYPDAEGNTVYHLDKIPVTPAYPGS